MARVSNRLLAFFMLLASFCMTAIKTAYAVATITCGTNGNFNSGGAINTQATITSPNNVTLSTAGAITYAATINGPAAGTPISCAMAGWKANAAMTPACDASRIIQSSGGCCGTVTRNMTAFTIKGRQEHHAGRDRLQGIGTNLATFKTDGTGAATLTFGTTMDATHATIGGTYPAVRTMRRVS